MPCTPRQTALGSLDRIYHPAFGADIAVGTDYVPDDPDGQVAATIQLMRRYANEDAQSPAIRRDLQQALGGRDPRSLSQLEIVDRVFHWVKGRLTFMDDGGLAGMAPGLHNPQAPVVEVLIRPRDMAVMCEQGACHRVGDCDDFSMYTAALLGAAGVKSSFVTVAADQAEPDRYSHVYVAAYPDGQRVPMDTSHGPRPGWETGAITRIQEWPLGAGSSELMAAALVIGVVLYMRGVI